MAEVFWSDNNDGTGGIAIIQGSAAGDVHTFWTSRYAGGIRNDIWQNSGTLAGDGTLPVTLPTGPFHGFLSTQNGAVQTFSAPIGFRVHDEQKALHERCCWALRDFVLGLSLPLVPDDPDLHVVVKVGAKLETVVRKANPKAAVYYIPAPESYLPLDNHHDTVRLPVIIALLVESGQTLNRGLTEIMWFRERLHRSMDRCGNLGLPEIHGTELQPGAVVDAAKWLDNYDASSCTVVCVTEQQHGIV